MHQLDWQLCCLLRVRKYTACARIARIQWWCLGDGYVYIDLIFCYIHTRTWNMRCMCMMVHIHNRIRVYMYIPIHVSELITPKAISIDFEPDRIWLAAARVNRWNLERRSSKAFFCFRRDVCQLQARLLLVLVVRTFATLAFSYLFIRSTAVRTLRLRIESSCFVYLPKRKSH